MNSNKRLRPDDFIEYLGADFLMTRYPEGLFIDSKAWPEGIIDQVNTLPQSAYYLGVVTGLENKFIQPETYHVIGIERHPDSGCYTIVEVAKDCLEFNTWVRYGEGDWENRGGAEVEGS